VGTIIKKGVNILGITPEVCLVAQVADGCFAELGSSCEITSVFRITAFGYHGSGYAIDFGVDNFPKNVVRYEASKRVVKLLRERLPEYCDVVFGDKRHMDHIHVEIDLRKAYKSVK